RADVGVADAVVTLGDLLLDVGCRLNGELQLHTDTPSRVRLEAGGQAANAAAWAARAGSRARPLARRSDDAAGRLARERVAARGVGARGVAGAEPCGSVVVLGAIDGARSMLTDRGCATLLSPDDLAAAWLADAGTLHVTGYAL